MRLLLTRHGETDWNRANRVLGRTDEPMNRRGLEQAAELVRVLHGTDLAAVYASPLDRAMTVGRMAAEDHGLVCRPDDRLIEMDFGRMEGRLRDDPVYQAEKKKLFARYPGGESYLQAAARVYAFLDEITARHRGQTVLAVAHNGICRLAATYYRDMSEDEFFAFALKNCQILSFPE